MKNKIVVFAIFGMFHWGAMASQPDSLWRTVERKNFATHDEEVTYHDKKKLFATLRTYDKAGRLQTETNFKDYRAGIRQGFSKGFYANGQLYWSADYQNNIATGEFRVYYEDGTIKRREYYRKGGLRKEAYCYNQIGEEIPFYEFSADASFPNGDYALQAYLRKQIKNIKAGSQPEFYSCELLIQSDSLVSVIRYGPTERLPIDLLNKIISEMPRWWPAHTDQIAYDQPFTLNLAFKSNTVYISHLMPNYAGAFRKKERNNQVPTTSPLIQLTPRRRTL
jgi:hypothetical protein